MDQESPLLVASKHGSCEIVKILIDSGADVNETDSEGNSPLIHAAKEGKNRSSLGLFSADVTQTHSYHTCLGLLLEAGADVNMTNNEGTTALLETTALGNETSMKLLLKAGADVNRNDAKGMTALMYLARNRSGFGGGSVVPDPSTWIKL